MRMKRHTVTDMPRRHGQICRRTRKMGIPAMRTGKRAMPMRRPQNRPGIITGLRQSSGWNWWRPVRQRRKEAAIFTGWRMRVSTMRYRKYWKEENRMGEAEKMLEMSESSGLHPKPHLRNPAAWRTVRRHTGSLSDCGLPIHGRRSRQETGISSMTCTWMISLWR